MAYDNKCVYVTMYMIFFINSLPLVILKVRLIPESELYEQNANAFAKIFGGE